MFNQYKQAGLLLIPEKNCVPLVKWANLTLDHTQDFSQYEPCDYGLITGERSNIVAINLDVDNSPLAHAIPDNPCKKFGSKGFTAFFKYNGERSAVYKNDNGDVLMELLSNGRKCTIPPSINKKNNQPYKWIGEDLLDVVYQLPTLPQSFIDKYFPAPKPREKKELNYTPPSMEEARKLLDTISPDCSNDEWVRVGMALRSEFGDAAFPLFDSWSSGGQSYDARTIWTRWRSFDSHSISIGTLFHLGETIEPMPVVEETKAEESNSIQYTGEFDKDGNEIYVDFSIWDKDKKKSEPKLDWLESLPDSLVKDLAQWFDDTSRTPQSVLHVAAALCLVGCIMGHKYATDSDLRTNIYALGLAGSGTGKDHVRKMICFLLEEVAGEKLLMGEPVSHVGLINGLYRKNGVAFTMWDEFGRALAGINNPNAASHQRAIIDEMMKIFTSASSIFTGKEYASYEKEDDVKTIVQPNYCVYATTVHEHLYKNITSSDSIDGFLSRWLLFDVEKKFKRPGKPKKPKQIPDALLERFNSIYRFDPSTESCNYGLTIQPKVVEYSSDAQLLLNDYCDQIYTRIEKSFEDRDSLESVLNRMIEHTMKISLIVSDGKIIEREHLQWAINLVEYSTHNICNVIKEHIVESTLDASCKKLLAIIKQHKKISRSQLFAKSRWFKNPKERQEAVNELIEMGVIDVKEEEGKTKKTKYYIDATL